MRISWGFHFVCLQKSCSNQQWIFFTEYSTCFAVYHILPKCRKSYQHVKVLFLDPPSNKTLATLVTPSLHHLLWTLYIKSALAYARTSCARLQRTAADPAAHALYATQIIAPNNKWGARRATAQRSPPVLFVLYNHTNSNKYENCVRRPLLAIFMCATIYDKSSCPRLCQMCASERCN